MVLETNNTFIEQLALVARGLFVFFKASACIPAAFWLEMQAGAFALVMP